eukprot:comp9992_c0_seq2/m.11798 comp9992_c0_seq2/g.11798  ORF comp9992_c0_seq2/g.11798 comp9992_c0_seq2/m.11798 type:complete len:113 (-) comp9992_c0_seq2:252-590(-)
MPRVTLIRHAETLYNASHDDSLFNVPLSPFGRLQASVLQGEFDYLFHSPLIRTKMTVSGSRIFARETDEMWEIREIVGCRGDLLEGESEEIESEQSANHRINEFLKKITHEK